MSHIVGESAGKLLRSEVLISVIDFEIQRFAYIYNQNPIDEQFKTTLALIGSCLLHIRNEVLALQ